MPTSFPGLLSYQSLGTRLHGTAGIFGDPGEVSWVENDFPLEDGKEATLCDRLLPNGVWTSDHYGQPSRQNPHTELTSALDLIITSQPAKVKTSGAIDLGISDHHLVFAVFMTTKANPKPKYITTKAYKSLDIKQFRNDIEHAPWQLAGIFDDVDDSLYLWDYLFNNYSTRARWI